MFQRLTDFGYRRSFGQAVGFYLAYFFLIVIIGGILGAMGGLIFSMGYDAGARMGTVVAIIATFWLSLKISKAKGIHKSFKIILLIAFAPLISVFIGALGGLLPVAYLTTMKAPSEEGFSNNLLD